MPKIKNTCSPLFVYIFASLLIGGGVFLISIAQKNDLTATVTPPACPGLGYYSDNHLRASSENRFVDLALGSALQKGRAQLMSYAESLNGTTNVAVTALDPLPPGVSLREETVTGSIAGRIKYVYFMGTPTQEGEHEVRLKATSPGCPDDLGRVFFRIHRHIEGVQCALISTAPVQSGQPATLSWQIRGPVSSGSISPSLPGNASLSASGSGQTAPLTQDTEFTLTVNGAGDSATCSAKVRVGGWTNNTVEFVKTLLDMPTISRSGGGQGIYDAIFFNGRFVFSGSCGVKMDGRSVGGGLWTVKEDGSGSIQERDACIDAGSITNRIYHHGLVDGAYLYPDGTRGFVRGNASWASCVAPGTDPFDHDDCSKFGPGANRAVYYEADGDDKVSVVGLSPGDNTDAGMTLRGLWQVGFNVASGYITSGSGGRTLSLARLPGWTNIQSQSSNIAISFGFNKYFIGRELVGSSYSPFKVYAVENGSLRAIQDLPGNPTFIYHALDFSTTPERLVIYQSVTRNDPTRKILTYEATADGLRLAGERPVPTASGVDPRADNPPILKSGFGVWGEYLFWPDGEGFSVWKGEEKVATVRLPNGDRLFGIVVSRNGYIAVIAYYTRGDSRQTAAYLYRIGGVTPPAPPPPAGQADQASRSNGQATSCSQAGGNGCTFSIQFGEQPVGGYGELGCSGNKAHCVSCTNGYRWSGFDCVSN